jgi:nucleoside phosphorylase
METEQPIIFFSNAPLPPEEGQVTLEVLAELDDTRRGYPETKNLEQKFPQGQITLNPSSCLIFPLPPPANPEPSLLALDRSHWDLYLISIPFTLHPPYQHSTYDRFSFFVELDTSTQAIAQDLFPKHVLTPIASDTEYTISPMGTFQQLSPDTPPSGPRFRIELLQPKILAFGQGLPNFYWRYEAPGNGTGIQPETKYVFLIVRVPSGTTSIHGTIHCKATLTVRPFQFITYKKNADVNTFPFHWDITSLLQKTQTKIKEPSLQPPSLFDVCLVCALAEEAQALLAEISRQCHTTFQEGYSATLKRDYRHTTLQNRYGETLRVLVSWQPNSGAIETGLHVSSLVREMRPRFVGMTGICAGDPTCVALGDLVIAERTFLYDSGALVKDETGRTLYQHNTTTWQPHLETLQTLRMFTAWQSTIVNLPRPISRRQQEDWLLSTLLESPTHKLEDIPLQELQQHAPLWRKIVFALQSGPSPLLSQELQLIDPTRIQKRYYGLNEFPYLDPVTPTAHIRPIATGNTERADEPFADVRYPVQGTVAVDLEGAAFYRTLADFPDIQSLLVKGVCDYADQSRDETYRTYASTISAAYMLSFLQNYVRGKTDE